MTNTHPNIPASTWRRSPHATRRARHMIAGFSTAMPTLAEIWRHLEVALADIPDPVRRDHPASRRTRRTPGWTGRTCSPPPAPPSPRTATASPTPCTTCGTNWTRPRPLPTGTGRPHDQLPRRMRRQARQIRRGGMQPMMVINSGDPLPELAVVLVLPLGVALPLRTRPALRWPAPSSASPAGCTPVTAALVALVLGSATVTALVLVTFGAEVGSPRWLERLYAAVTVLAAGGWVAAAAVARPAHLAAAASPGHRRTGPGGAVVGAPPPPRPGPRGAQARGLARHRHARSGWPDHRSCPPLVDLWGWRARFRLARGQTITDVIAKIPAIESGLGTLPGRGPRLPDPR